MTTTKTKTTGKRILFATSECAPWIKTGGLGDVSAALPPALAALGHDVAVLLPAYAGLAQLDGSFDGIVSLPAEGHWPAAQLLRLRLPASSGGITLLLLACPALYARPGTPYGEPGGADHYDNALRFGLLARVAAQLGSATTPLPGWQADVVHANDWPSALAPLYLQQARDAGDASAARSVVTIHNLAFQGVYPMHVADLLGIGPAYRGIDGTEFWGQLSMLKAGLQFADAITTVSPTYADEIQTEAQGFALDGVLRARAERLHGVINGIDTHIWNPATDPLIAARYDADRIGGKAACKAALQSRLKLAREPGALLFGLVGRLTSQKGIDLVVAGAEGLLARHGQLAVLGSGDAALQAALTDLAARYPGRVGVVIGFDETLAHQIEAGADCFLMPSRFEPCGLNQMYSQAYGTPPLVAPVGGLADTVEDGVTGFVMREAGSQVAFDEAVARVAATWKNAGQWRRIQRVGMQRDFSWTEPADAYSAIYDGLGSA